MTLGLLCFCSGQSRAQEPADWLRLMTRDAILVSQAIGWSLEGPVSAAEVTPVAFAPGAMPKPIATGNMSIHNVMLLDYGTPEDEPNHRGLAGVIELADALDHRVLARFETDYDIATAGTYKVNGVAVTEMYPDSPRIEAYVLPAAAFGAGGLPALPPYAMLAAIRSKAINPATIDSAPRDYRVYVAGMDRLPRQADLGFTAIDATTGREVARSQSVRENGWVVASLPLAFAVNGYGGVYFPIVYRPDGSAGSERILMMFSNRTSGGESALAQSPAGKPALPGLPPAPALSAVGQGFMAKRYPNQSAPQ